jgi:hypothetical protein
MEGKRTLLGSAAVLAVLVAAGCSGGSSRSAGTAASPSGTAASPSGTASASPAPPAASSPAAGAPEVNPQGDIPDNQQYVAYSPPDRSYTVRVPEGWSRTGTSPVTFTDKLNSIRLETAARPSRPAPAAVQSELAAIKATAGHFSGGTVKTVTRPSGPVLVALYRADAPADPVTGKVRNDDIERYEFWKAGRLVILTLAGPHGADNVDPWRIVTDSFRWTS